MKHTYTRDATAEPVSVERLECVDYVLRAVSSELDERWEVDYDEEVHPRLAVSSDEGSPSEDMVEEVIEMFLEGDIQLQNTGFALGRDTVYYDVIRRTI